jgi:hypothetical protein
MEVVRQRTTVADHLVLEQVYALHQGPGKTPSLARFAAPNIS